MPTRATDSTSGDGAHLRLLCPQWQGAGTSSVRDLASEFPLDVAGRGYAVAIRTFAPDDRHHGHSGRRRADHAKFFPCQMMHLRQILDGFPLLTPARR